MVKRQQRQPEQSAMTQDMSANRSIVHALTAHAPKCGHAACKHEASKMSRTLQRWCEAWSHVLMPCLLTRACQHS
eukprot:4935706-Amphidinium_carterae.1